MPFACAPYSLCVTAGKSGFASIGRGPLSAPNLCTLRLKCRIPQAAATAGVALPSQRLCASCSAPLCLRPPPDGSIKNIDAFRSSKQAAPVTCFFQNLRVDKCNPTLEHVPSNWHPTAPLPHSFKCRYDPVHNAIRNRDRPVPLALCIIRVAELMHAPRPHIFSRQTSSPHTSRGSCNGDLN